MDYYEILGLKQNASKPQIKEAFKKLAMKFHPDKHSGSSKSVQESATLKFKQVSEAYQVLTNDSKRADYDARYGSGRGNRGSGFASTSSSYGGSYGYRCRYGTGDYDAFRERYRHRYANGSSGGGLGFGAVIRFLSSPAVLISIAFASVMVATTFIFDTGNDRLRKLRDYEKCKHKYYEEAVEAMRREDLRLNHRARGRPNKAHSYYYHYPPRGDDSF